MVRFSPGPTTSPRTPPAPTAWSRWPAAARRPAAAASRCRRRSRSPSRTSRPPPRSAPVPPSRSTARSRPRPHRTPAPRAPRRARPVEAARQPSGFLALVVANHIVLSQLNRNLTASGNVSFTANGASANDTEAKSSAAGAPEKDGSSASTTVNGGSQDLSGGTLVVHDTSKFKSTGSFKVAGGTGTCSYGSKTATEFDTVSACTGTPDDGAAVTQDDNSTDSSGKDVNGKADDNLKVGNDRSKESDNGKDSGDGSTPKAKSGENGGTTVTVAAAVGIAVITAHSLANIADSTTLSTGGSLSLTSSEDVDS